MLITIDTVNKTISLDGELLLSEVTKVFNEILPVCEDYKIIPKVEKRLWDDIPWVKPNDIKPIWQEPWTLYKENQYAPYTVLCKSEA